MSSKKHNATCSICGNKYTVCRTCADQLSLKPWRTVTDTAEHYKIYLAIHGYTLSKDKEKAKKELERCDLSELENFNSEIRSVINEIMTENKKAKTVSKKETLVKPEKVETENIDE